jgi:CDP-diacylglycerol--inositol 3-phosphatidyltransferase
MASIYWYVPNLIGYTRVILLVLALYYIYNGSLMLGGTFYIASYLLDAMDGVTARALNQCMHI